MSKRNRVPKDVYIKHLFEMQQLLLGFYIDKYGVPDPQTTEDEQAKKLATGIHKLLNESAHLAIKLGLVKRSAIQEEQGEIDESNNEIQEDTASKEPTASKSN